MMNLIPNRIPLSLSAVFVFVAAFAQTPDTAYQNRIQEFTTDDRFLPGSVASIVDHSDVPSPMDHFGSIIGAPGVMHRTSEIYGYFQALADASPNLIMEQVGTSEEGRAIQLVTISATSTITNLDFYKDILSQLADPRQINEDDAGQLSRDGKPVYYLSLIHI